MKFKILILVFVIAQACYGQKVEVKNLPDDRKIEVYIDQKLFTAYIYPTDQEKPVLYPIIAASGDFVTRGYPLDPRPREQVDHLHHVGSWLNYGEVNEIDFWGHSKETSDERKKICGTIYHSKINKVESGKEGKIEVESLWKSPKGETMIKEKTTFVFSSKKETRIIDRITELTAVSGDLSFHDSKEGFYAIRVTRELEQPTDNPVFYTDEMGVALKERKIDNDGVSGNYLSSEGLTGDDVWGTRAKWTMLKGKIGVVPTAVAIIDHPENVGYPTYWMARGYGLFAANPFGQKIYSEGKEELNFLLKKGESTVLKYRMAIHAGSDLNARKMEKLTKDFEMKF